MDTIHMEKYPHDDSTPGLITENESLVRHNRKLSNALRSVIKEVRDHRYRVESQTPTPKDDTDLWGAVEEIASEFGGLYGTV
jgi:hypothetical protein